MDNRFLKVLVTGGAGFIGSHVVEQFLSKGHEVCVLDNFSSGKRQNLPTHGRLQIFGKDILKDSLSDVPFQPDVIVHMAAQPSVVASWEQPYAAHQANLSAVMKMIEWRRVWNTPRIVWASSAAVYGDPGVSFVDESVPALPLSPYGFQKRSGELLLEMFAKHDGFDVVSLRMFNVFGPRQDPASPYSGVISLFVRRLISGEDLLIFGDGEQTRDFVYVEDVARAFVAAAESGVAGCHSVNIATGRARTVNELAATLASLMPLWRGKIIHHESRAGEILYSCADIARASKLLSYGAEVSFEAGLEKTFHYLHSGGLRS